MNPKENIYPEVHAGGFTRIDGTVEFYNRVNALISPDMTILDYGAGRGEGIQEDSVKWRQSLRFLRGKVSRVIGIDVDNAICENPGLDECYVVGEGEQFPLPNDSVDIVVSDAVFEHIDSPRFVSSELARVLKKGGWICARTPNRFGYIGLATNLIPNSMHIRVLKHLQPDRKAVDVFPTRYKLNTRVAIRRHFPREEWMDSTYGHFAEPAYFGRSEFFWRLAQFTYRFTPELLAPTWMIFLKKR